MKILKIRWNTPVWRAARRVVHRASRSWSISSSAVLISRIATSRPSPSPLVCEYDKVCSNSRLKPYFAEGKAMDGSGPIAIGRLAKRTGTNIETIRYYERVGLLPAPARSQGGYRLYGTEHLKRLNFVRRARALGFSIGEVRTLLRLADERRRPCAEVRVVAEAHLRDVRAKLADLRRMERVLKATVAGCAEGRRSDCPVIEALYRDGNPDRQVSAPRSLSGARGRRRRVLGAGR